MGELDRPLRRREHDLFGIGMNADNVYRPAAPSTRQVEEDGQKRMISRECRIVGER
jgi:hypothetical protein